MSITDHQRAALAQLAQRVWYARQSKAQRINEGKEKQASLQAMGYADRGTEFPMGNGEWIQAGAYEISVTSPHLDIPGIIRVRKAAFPCCTTSSPPPAPVEIHTYRARKGAQHRPYHYLKDAQRQAQEVCAPFLIPHMHLPPRQFQEAVPALKAIKTTLLALREALYDTAAISRDLAIQRVQIDGYISLLLEHIDRRLIPSCWWNKKGDFSLLLTALDEIEKRFPEHERF